MKKNNIESALELEIELLKNNLLGKTYKMNKGVNLEEMFNYKQNPRNFEVDMIGLVLVKKNDKNANEESTLDSRETNVTNKEQYLFEMLKYEFHPKKDKNIGLNYENIINIKYNIKKFKLSPQNVILMDLCEKLKEIGKKKKSDSKSYNLFERAQSLINQGGESIEKIKTEKIDNVLLNDYINKIVEFSKIIKNEFNSAQDGFPNIIKFSKLKAFLKDESDNIFFFHSNFRRELDGGYKIIKKYDFNKVSGFTEEKIGDSYQSTYFNTDDILLFELKDSLIDNIAIKCIKENYKVINGYIKVIKKEKQFQNCRFFYIGIQEGKESEKDKDTSFKKENITIDFDELKVKLFTFYNGKIFGEDCRTMNKKRIEILNILKPEFENIDKRFENVDKRFENVDKSLKSLEENIIKINNNLEILLEKRKKSYAKEIIQFTKFYFKKIILLTALLIILIIILIKN